MFIFSVFIVLLQPPQDHATQLPDQLKKMILDEFPGSKLVACVYDKHGKKKPSTFIQGDFNGDSKPDFAMIVNVNVPPPNCYCVVFISHDSLHTMKVLKDPYMYCSPYKTLTLNQKGSMVYDYATESEIVLVNDAFTIYTGNCWTFTYDNNNFKVIGGCD